MIQFRRRNRGDLTYQEIKRAYIKAFHIPPWRVVLSDIATLLSVGGIFRFADATYRAMTDQDEQRLFAFLERDETNLERYQHPDFDCDDFEFRLHGALHQDRDFAAMPIFILWVSWALEVGRAGHALGTYYKDGEVKTIEPQNDKVGLPHDYWRLDLLCG